MKKLIYLFLFIFFCLFSLAGCATTGGKYSSESVNNIYKTRYTYYAGKMKYLTVSDMFVVDGFLVLSQKTRSSGANQVGAISQYGAHHVFIFDPKTNLLYGAFTGTKEMKYLLPRDRYGESYDGYNDILVLSSNNASKYSDLLKHIVKYPGKWKAFTKCRQDNWIGEDKGEAQSCSGSYENLILKDANLIENHMGKNNVDFFEFFLKILEPKQNRSYKYSVRFAYDFPIADGFEEIQDKKELSLATDKLYFYKGILKIDKSRDMLSNMLYVANGIRASKANNYLAK